MIAGRAKVVMLAGALVAAGIAIAPAFGAHGHARVTRSAPAGSTARFQGTFTPAAADPRLAAAFARGGLGNAGFRFTPADSRRDRRALTVAVRARSNRTVEPIADQTRLAVAAAPTTVGIAPIAYSLGAAMGWKRFAVSGNVSRIDLGPQPGSREAADVAVVYHAGRGSSRLAAAADRPLSGSPKAVEDMPGYSVDLSSSYSLTRNFDVTAGLRYRSDRERIARSDDDRRDSQAVYLGTAFRF